MTKHWRQFDDNVKYCKIWVYTTSKSVSKKVHISDIPNKQITSYYRRLYVTKLPPKILTGIDVIFMSYWGENV